MNFHFSSMNDLFLTILKIKMNILLVSKTLPKKYKYSIKKLKFVNYMRIIYVRIFNEINEYINYLLIKFNNICFFLLIYEKKLN
jgi:hypothetical protein